MTKDWHFSTKAIHLEQAPDENSRVVSEPIVPAVAYSFSNAEEAARVVSGEEKGVYYGRYGNPTTRTVEKKVAALEGSEDALGVSSGMAAISISLLYYLKQGDHVIVTRDVYGGTHKFLTTFAVRYGIETDFIDCTDVNKIEEAIKSNTRAIYIETPSNPGLCLIDIEAVAQISQAHNLPLIVDNTFMTPCLQNPLELGADVVIHSATKYLNGHGDAIAGFICADEQTIKDMHKNFMGDLGQPLNAWESFLILRGIKTLGIRMEKHCDNAQKVAEFLDSHDLVENVYYPGLPSHPQHDLAKRQMRGTGGIVSFEINGGLEEGKKFISLLELAMISFSLGDPETLVQHPGSMTHSSIPEEELKFFGISKGLIRLSVGLEDARDIIADLKQAFDKMAVTSEKV
ncbi:MAG TPA: aminotransferase class I/II-fold pyridoxal phosphate-dependent enzyme [Candidatus Avamphibacillus sp.]|nr:aminotransferase class I/II-fold pyridoxal phosphate-dependent enzyme [Candidatus Avamphibacillus sp.]